MMKETDLSVRSLRALFVKVITSYGLVAIVLTLMLILVLFGTLEQTERGLYDVQRAYFNSFFVVHHLGPVPIPLPGGYLLMSILFFNLLAGAIIKARKDWRRPGMLIAHSGILFLLLGGFVTYYFSTSGNMALHEKESSDEVLSYYDWQIEVAKVGPENRAEEALVIPSADFKDMEQDEQRIFYSEELPFEIVVNGFARNSQVLQEGALEKGAVRSKPVDGFFLQPLPPENEAERNIAGAYVVLKEKASGTEHEAILWGVEQHPYLLSVGDERWAVHLAREKWKVPFEVHLDDFTAEWHPGTRIPRVFASDITKTENGIEEKIKISMNEPLRHRGYTFFQASWGPEGAGPNDRLFSVFAVVKNPADQWPMWSCWIVGIGLLIHFLQKLLGYLKNSRKLRQPA